MTCILSFVFFLWVYRQWYDQIMCVLRLFVFCFFLISSFIHVYSTSRSEPILSFASFFFLCVYFILDFEHLVFSQMFVFFSSSLSAVFYFIIYTVLLRSSSSFSFQIYICIHIFIYFHSPSFICLFFSWHLSRWWNELFVSIIFVFAELI